MKFKNLTDLKKTKNRHNIIQIKNARRFAIGFLLISSLFTTVNPLASASHTTVDILAEFQAYSVPVGIVVTDQDAIDAGTVQVTVTTTRPGVGVIDSITLTLTETASGVFDNIDPSTLVAKLWLMDGDNKFPLESTRIIRYEDPGVYDSSATETVTIPVTWSGGGVTLLDLIETGDETDTFEGQLTYSATDPFTGDPIEITAGEIFNILYPCDGSSNGQITPIPDGATVGAIRADIGDTITVMYEDSSHTDTAILNSGGVGCGGSGGGLVINPIVLDVLAGGTSGGDFAPPLLTISKLNLSNLPLIGEILNFIQNANPFTVITPLDVPSIDYPVSINGNGYLLTQYANTIQTYTGKTGEPVSFKMTLFDATGVEHIALYTNLRGDAREIQDSDTYVVYNEDKPLEITDPQGFFSNVNFTESEYNGKYIADFDLTFAKPMDTSDVIIRTWDEYRNSGDIKIFYAIKIEGEQLVNPDTNNLIIPDSAEIVIPYYKLPYYEIPDADSQGNLIYYNSFGGLEHKQVNPYSNPIIYPDDVGKAERHDDRFYESIINEDVRAQAIAKTIVGNPFTLTEDNQKDVKFYYPSNVGKLDRENKEMKKDIMLKEYVKAAKISSKLYNTNHLED